MRRSQLDLFADENLDYCLKLAIARDLERLYASLLVPSHLQAFIARLGRALEQRR